jgi:hypothetical protein
MAFKSRASASFATRAGSKQYTYFTPTISTLSAIALQIVVAKSFRILRVENQRLESDGMSFTAAPAVPGASTHAVLHGDLVSPGSLTLRR